MEIEVDGETQLPNTESYFYNPFKNLRLSFILCEETSSTVVTSTAIIIIFITFKVGINIFKIISVFCF